MESVPLPKPQPGFHSLGNLSSEISEDLPGSFSSSRLPPPPPPWKGLALLIEAGLPEGRVKPYSPLCCPPEQVCVN